ncbi:MAG TPA: hypothetical protein VM101_00805 [Flavitalea sp.]|nr:hypothetical protein [Flavitalea sp.]
MKVLYPSVKIFLLIITLIGGASLNAQNKAADPVVIVKNRSDKNVNLSWPAFTGDVSQYVLERSIDARKFQEICVYVSMFSNNEASFEFTDRFRSPYAGPLYYRLRIDGLDGSVVYTPVTILKAVQNKYTE